MKVTAQQIREELRPEVSKSLTSNLLNTGGPMEFAKGQNEWPQMAVTAARTGDNICPTTQRGS